jgi:hypothetical protein
MVTKLTSIMQNMMMLSVIIENFDTVFANFLHFSKLNLWWTFVFVEFGSFKYWGECVGVKIFSSF